MRKVSHIALAVAALSISGPAQADMFKPSKKDQVTLGKRAAKDIEKQVKLLPSSDVRVVKLREIAGRLLAANPIPKEDPWEFTFNIVNDKSMNAFALPGGPIYFYSGLYDKFTTEDQIAGVLAHEMTHVKKEHWAYSYADQQKRSLGLSLILIFTRAGRTAADIASISNDLLLTLPYMRKHESEADNLGLDSMIAAGYNPQGMVDAFKILISGSGSRPPEFLSTHPDTKKRIASLETRIKAMNRTFPAQMRVPWASGN